GAVQQLVEQRALAGAVDFGDLIQYGLEGDGPLAHLGRAGRFRRRDRREGGLVWPGADFGGREDRRGADCRFVRRFFARRSSRLAISARFRATIFTTCQFQPEHTRRSSQPVIVMTDACPAPTIPRPGGRCGGAGAGRRSWRGSGTWWSRTGACGCDWYRHTPG